MLYPLSLVGADYCHYHIKSIALLSYSTELAKLDDKQYWII
jgi:hypothetical protein